MHSGYLWLSQVNLAAFYRQCVESIEALAGAEPLEQTAVHLIDRKLPPCLSERLSNHLRGRMFALQGEEHCQGGFTIAPEAAAKQCQARTDQGTSAGFIDNDAA